MYGTYKRSKQCLWMKHTNNRFTLHLYVMYGTYFWMIHCFHVWYTIINGTHILMYLNQRQLLHTFYVRNAYMFDLFLRIWSTVVVNNSKLLSLDMSLINTSKKNKDSCIGQNKTSRFKDTKSTPWLKSRATKFSYISGIFGKYSKSPHWYDKYQIKPLHISFNVENVRSGEFGLLSTDQSRKL